MCKNWGYTVLAGVAWKESIEEMKHADEIIERILFLDGTPNLSAYDKINVGSAVKQQLENDLGLEEGALVVLKAGIKPVLRPMSTPAGSCSSIYSSMKRSMSTGSNRSCIKSKRSVMRTIWRSRSSKRVSSTERRQGILPQHEFFTDSGSWFRRFAPGIPRLSF